MCACLLLACAGPSYTVPFLGSIVEMVQDPHAFWERQRAYSFPGLSWNSIVTKFTVMVTDPAVIRHVFQHNRWEGRVCVTLGWNRRGWAGHQG
jgi:cytochrome P450 family 710 subfamily A protein